MKATRLIIAALLLSLLSSCSLLNSILQVPNGLLKAVGRTAGIGLTDEAPDPVAPTTVEHSVPTKDEAAAE